MQLFFPFIYLFLSELGFRCCLFLSLRQVGSTL